MVCIAFDHRYIVVCPLVVCQSGCLSLTAGHYADLFVFLFLLFVCLFACLFVVCCCFGGIGFAFFVCGWGCVCACVRACVRACVCMCVLCGWGCCCCLLFDLIYYFWGGGSWLFVSLGVWCVL